MHIVCRTTLAASVALLASLPCYASDQSDAFTCLEQLVAAWNRNDAAGVTRLMTETPAIIDEFSPYHWAGPTALADWNRDVDTHTKEIGGVSDPRVALSKPTELDVHGDTAYAVVPTTYRYTVHAKQVHENGILTAALLKTGTTWRVAAFAWTNLKAPVQQEH
jgi:ketosteroid isomerase-like protein